MKHLTYALLITLPVLLMECSHPADLTEHLTKIAKDNELTGMSVVVTQKGRIVYEGYFGKRDLGRNLPVTADTKYRVASISKTVTAIAIMQLYEKGLFNLNDDAGEYLDFPLRNPNFPDQVVTVEKLLSHCSSIRDADAYYDFLYTSYKKDPVPAIRDLMTSEGQYFSPEIWFDSAGPGAEYFQYCNLNFGILGTIVEKLSGQRFDLYCQQHIFKPLEITGSFNIDFIPDIDQMAVLYRKSEGKWIPQKDNYNGVRPAVRDLTYYKPGTNGALYAPQGGLKCSARDLAILQTMLARGGSYKGVKILQPETVVLMTKPVWRFNETNGDNFNGIFKEYALGNHSTRDLIPGINLTGHLGMAYGLLSDSYFAPEEKFGITFITNGGLWQPGIHSGWYAAEEAVFSVCWQWLEK